MFDPVKPFPVKITSGGQKECILRWPTDEQWAQRARETKVIRRVLGGGYTKRERTTSVEASRKLFAAVHVSGGEAFDEFEQAAAINKLDRSEVTEVARKADLFRITMKVAGGHTVSHRLRVPTLRQSFNYENQAATVMDHRRTQEIQMFLEPSATLWDAISDGVEGYAEGAAVPITHKDAAVMELLAAMAEQEDEPDPEA